MKPSFLTVLFTGLIGLIPATEASSVKWYQYWGGVASVGGIIALFFYLGRKFKKKSSTPGEWIG